MKRAIYTTAVVALFAASTAHAAPIIADFREELSLPYCCGPDVRVLEDLAELVPGAPDLDDADEISNPSGYTGHAEIDLTSTGLITLTGREPGGFANYERAVFRISNIVFDAGEVISGVIVLDGTGIFDNQFGPSTPAPDILFSANSVTISYDIGSANANDFNFGEGQTAMFQLQFRNTQVPEPASLALIGAGLFGAALRRRLGRA